MSDTTSHDQLIARLATELRPVRPLLAPWLRTLIWFALVTAIGTPLALITDWPGLYARLSAVPDMWASQLGAVLTAICAACAALQSGIPGRTRVWALLPIPPALLWVAASTAGCLRPWHLPATIVEPHGHEMACLKLILLLSLPFGAVLTWLLVRACPLRPALTVSLAGLASAAAAASLLTLIHPFDATAVDLSMHLLAVIVVVGVCRLGAVALRA